MPQARGWKTVALPDELVKKVDDIVEKEKDGYRTRNEFVTDAVRRRLEELKPLSR